MKNSKLPIIILTVLLVVCAGGSAVLYSTQSGSLSDLQTSESKLTSEVESLKLELSDKDSVITVLSNEKQAFTDQVSNLESEKNDAKAKLEKVESTLAIELSSKDNWAKYMEPEKIKGNWTSVNYVDDEMDFDPSKQASYDLFLKGLEFYDTTVSFDLGKNSSGTSFWVDDHIYDEESTMGFMLKKIDDVEYLFVEWKGDDVVKHSDIGYYVLKRSE